MADAACAQAECRVECPRFPEEKEIPRPFQDLQRPSSSFNCINSWLKGSPGERAALQDVYEASTQEGPELLKRWCRWAARSRLAPFKKLAQTFRQYWDGIVSYFQCRVTQGAIEAINGIIQLAKRRARGFRNFVYLRIIAYWVAGQLKANLPPYLPTLNSEEAEFSSGARAQPVNFGI